MPRSPRSEPIISLVVGVDGRVFVDGLETFVTPGADPWQVAFAEAAARAGELGIDLPARAVVIGPDDAQWQLDIQPDGTALPSGDRPVDEGTGGARIPRRSRTAGSRASRSRAAIASLAIAAVGVAAWAVWPAQARTGPQPRQVAAGAATGRAPSRLPAPLTSPSTSSQHPHPHQSHRRHQHRHQAGRVPVAGPEPEPTGPQLCQYTDPSGSVYLEPCPTP